MVQVPSDILKGGRYTEWPVDTSSLQGVSCFVVQGLDIT